MRVIRSMHRCSAVVAGMASAVLLTPQAAVAHPVHTWATQTGTMPAERAYAAMANVPGVGLIMYGGCWRSPCPTDTWKWTGSAWTQILASGGPTYCADAQMVYDFANAQIVLACPSFAPPLSGTHVAIYTFDPVTSTWTDRTFASTVKPPERQHFVLTYDVFAARVVLFGGFANNGQIKNDTWEWNGSTYQWNQTHAQGSPTAPPPRYAAAAAYHVPTGKSVVFGGGPHGGAQPTDTWGYDALSDTWTQLAVVGPPERWKAAMAYDSAHGEIVLHAGFNLALNTHLNDTWVWNGTAWVAHTPTGPFRYGHAMAYHPASNKTVVFGGGPLQFGTTDETNTYG